jgi:hypothetical protein
MQSAIYVIGIIIVLAIIYMVVPGGYEGFEDKTRASKVNIPQAKLDIPTEVAGVTAPSLPSAPYYGISEERPLPAIDPADEVTKIHRMRRLLERLEAFFLTDYKVLEGKVEFLGPYTNSKAMLSRLREEVHFLEANPGMPPTLTEKKILESEATLSFLERESRLITINEIDNYDSVEGFVSGPRTGRPGGGAPAPARPAASNTPARSNAPSRPSASTSKTRATLKDLADFNLRAWAEIQRLGSSGTTNPITRARIDAISKIRQSVSRIIEQVRRREILEIEIPLYKEDIENSFPNLADPTKDVSSILAKFDLPPELNNLLPPGKQTASNAKEVADLVKQYISSLLNSTSFSLKLGVKYTSPQEVSLEQAKARTTFNPYTQGSKLDLTFTGPDGKKVDNVNISAANSDRIDNAGQRGSSSKQDPTNNKETWVPTMDWKVRTKEICNQIRMRGLDPQDFGCLKDSDEVSSNYGWRGHAMMVCSRLIATPDPALPETCGCPPKNWKGWDSPFDV